MIEVLLFVGTGSLLFGATTLVVAVLTLRDARRYVELAEHRLEYLREGQTRLVAFLEQEHRFLGDITERVAEERRDAGRRVADTEREFRGARRQDPIPAVADSVGKRSTNIGRVETLAGVARGGETTGGRAARPASSLETTGREPKEGSARDGKPGRGVWHAHPDEKAGRPGDRGGAPVEMFRKHYDKYLENYRGYVELAEGLCRMRGDGEAGPASSAGREREEKLRRIKSGIERTTARLDILEGHNPELVSDDDRVSRRASVARRHAKLGQGR